MSNDIVKAQPGPSLPDMVQYAERLAHANLLPSQYRKQPANVLYAMEYGRTLGITPIAAITGIHVIEGKPTASAALISALVRKAGHKLRVTSDGATRATAQIIRSDDPEFVYEATWTLERAQQAGLTNKDVWRKYPAAMLKARAITEVARDACEEVLFGLHYTPEELGAYVDQDGNPVDAPVQPLYPVGDGRQPAPAVTEPTAAEGRDYLHEAHQAPDAETVRGIYRQAAADGAAPEYLAQIAEVGRGKAAAEQQSAEHASQDGGEPVEGEIVPDPPADEHARAVAELRAAAQRAGLPDIDTEFERSYGLPPDQAATASVREMTALLSGAA